MPSYDFYIDEDKQNHRLGVLAVSNAVALNQILESIRDQYGIRREVKWGAMDRFRLPVAVSWIRVAAWFHSVRFGSLPWPDNAQKGGILVEFFKTFLDRYGTTLPHGKFDSVAFLDFDNVDIVHGDSVGRVPGISIERSPVVMSGVATLPRECRAGLLLAQFEDVLIAD